MKTTEIKQIAEFLADVDVGICEWDVTEPMQRYLYELYGGIERLMDATFEASDQDKKLCWRPLKNGRGNTKPSLSSGWV